MNISNHNNQIELLIDEAGNKYCVVKNIFLDLTDKNIMFSSNIKILNNKSYYKNKLIHREDGPAIEWSDGDKHWYLNGETHREDGPAVEKNGGYKEWHKNGVLHREDGPAIENSHGDKYWFKNGLKHRLDGAAIEYGTGNKEYYINGVEISEENFYLEKELREYTTNNNKSKKNKI